MNNLDQELDSILHKIGTDINKVYSSNPVGPWCMNHYFKLIKGECVGCEAKQAIQAFISDQVARARIEELEHIISGSEYSADDFDWYEITRAEYTGTKYYSEVRHLTKEERIAELEATLNGVKNK